MTESSQQANTQNKVESVKQAAAAGVQAIQVDSSAAFEFKIPKLPSPISLSACASFESLDKLSQSQKTSTFNAESVPNSFDVFMHDLRKSSSSSTSVNQIAHSSNGTKASGKQFLTSSMDKDLNSDSSSIINSSSSNLKGKKVSRAVLKSLDLDDADDCCSSGIDVKTSSPFKRPSIPVFSSSSSSSALNRTIDIDKGGSSESLSTNNSRRTTSSSVESFGNMKGFMDDGGSSGSVDRPSPVLNTTYNAWSADENLEFEAGINEQQPQVGQVNGSSNKTIVFNKTQDFNNNFDENADSNCQSISAASTATESNSVIKKKRISGNKKVCYSKSNIIFHPDFSRL
jgi:hypothetical protein